MDEPEEGTTLTRPEAGEPITGSEARVSRWLASPRLAAVRNLSRPSDRSVERVVRLLILFAAATANIVGAVAVAVIAIAILPTGDLEGQASITGNLILAAAYVALAVPAGAVWAIARTRPGRRWLREERLPTAEEQRNLLRSPLHVALVVGSLWTLAAAVFALYNGVEGSRELGQRVGITVLLSGLTTSVVAYLLCERLLRPAAARALAARPLDSPAMPGVTARALFAWALGSGIPIFGMLLIAVSALTEKDFSRNDLAIAVLALAAVGLSVGFFAVLLAARVTAAPVESVRAALTDIRKGKLETEVPVYDGTEVGMLQSGFNRMVAGLRERERIRELFGMHVGEDVARAAMERETGLGGETREVAVLFVDIVGSTTIASTRPAAEVVELLNAFFGIVVEVVDANQGWVNKFEGDAALAIFGAPEPLDDAPGRALAAGRELADRLLGEMPGASAGIGVSYGSVVAGNIGSEHRFEYTVIGDAVNEAARLTELAKDRPGMLVASGAAARAAGAAEAAQWTVTEEIQLRGRARRTELALPSATVEASASAPLPDRSGRPGSGRGEPPQAAG